MAAPNEIDSLSNIAPDSTSCSFCNKEFSSTSNLNKHMGKCKLLSVSCRSLRKNTNQSGPKVYRVDKSLDLYVNTCDNDYAKFMCCENDHSILYAFQTFGLASLIIGVENVLKMLKT